MLGMLRNLLVAVFVMVVAGLVAQWAAAAEPTPEATVKQAYAATLRSLASSGPKASPPAWRPPHRDRLLSKGLAALFARDDLYQDESGEMGNIGADPFLNGQDGEVKNLRVAVTGTPADGQALVTASFQSLGKTVTVPFRMIWEAGAWRIDDIGDGSDSIREALSQPYECGSFMKKPCTR